MLESKIIDKQVHPRGRFNRSSPSVGIPDVRFMVLFPNNAVVLNQVPHAAALNIATEGASIISGGKPILPQVIVVCRRRLNGGYIPPGLESLACHPLQVIDPGGESSEFFIPGGSRVAPSVSKGFCRPHSPCADAGDGCGNCCNNNK